jgi:hypothetical protein
MVNQVTLFGQSPQVDGGSTHKHLTDRIHNRYANRNAAYICCQHKYPVTLFAKTPKHPNHCSRVGRSWFVSGGDCTTNPEAPTVLRWGFFLPVLACLQGFLRVLVDFARQSLFQFGGHISLSLGHYSPLPCPFKKPQSGRSENHAFIIQWVTNGLIKRLFFSIGRRRKLASVTRLWEIATVIGINER